MHEVEAASPIATLRERTKGFPETQAPVSWSHGTDAAVYLQASYPVRKITLPLLTWRIVRLSVADTIALLDPLLLYFLLPTDDLPSRTEKGLLPVMDFLATKPTHLPASIAVLLPPSLLF